MMKMISKKKGWIIGLGLVVALGGTSAAVAADAAGSYIGKAKAKQLALKEVPGTVTDIELEHNRDGVYYEVDIDRENSYQEVDVYVDAYTGKVLRVVNDDDDAPRNVSPAASAAATASPSKASPSATAAQPTSAPSAANSPSATAAPSASSASGTSNAKPSSAKPSTAKPSAAVAASGTSSATAKGITKEQAAKLAQEAVKGGEVIRISTDRDDGILEYEVKLKLARGYAEVEIAAATGKVLDIDYDDFDDDDDDFDDFDDDDDHDDDNGHDDDRRRG
jgi:uncharacterized membrane protein YkoI